MAPRLNRALVLENFKVCVGSENVKCKICGTALKKNRIFNLKSHLLRLHGISISDSGTCINVAKAKVKKLFRKQTIKIEISKEQLYRSYIGLVTEDNIPFDVLDSENMRSIIEPICQGLGGHFNKKFCLNSTNCKAVLKSVAADIRNNIKAELKHHLISLKIDSATRIACNKLAVSVQFIRDSAITPIVLGMVELTGTESTSSRNLAAETMKILCRYGIKLNQVVSITSADDANVIKAIQILSHCGALLTSYEEGEEEETIEVCLKNIELFEVSKNPQLGDIDICGCAAEIVHLCALDVAKDPSLNGFLSNCRNLLKCLEKNANGYREVFKLQELSWPQLDCPTRWGSTYDMICSIHKAKEILEQIDSITNGCDDENFELSRDFWDFVSSYCTVFESLHKIFIKFEEDQLHYGNFYAQWLKCKLMTKKIAETKVESKHCIVHKLAKKLLDCIESRNNTLLANESLNACLFLDPRFSHTLTAEKKRSAIIYLQRLYDKVKAMGFTAPEHKNASDAEANETSDDMEEEDKDLNEYLSHSFVPQNDDGVDAYSKIENLKLPFQRVEVNVLEFWSGKQFTDPELYALANICFAIPPTQVTTERAVSSMKLILSDSRNRHNHEALENVLMLKLNPSFLDRAIAHMPLFEDIQSDDNEDP